MTTHEDGLREALAVTQADREAAWHYAGFHCLPDRQMRERWFSGYYDDTAYGEAIRNFARHRIAALSASPKPASSDPTCPVCKNPGCGFAGVPANCDVWGKSDLAEALEVMRDEVIAAYAAGAQAVHDNYRQDRDPDFGESALDYFAGSDAAAFVEKHRGGSSNG